MLDRIAKDGCQSRRAVDVRNTHGWEFGSRWRYQPGAG
jgi:hypothetical protein